MNGRVFLAAVFCAVFAGTGAPEASRAFAQNDPGEGYVIIDAQTDEAAESCCGYLGVSLDDLTARVRDKYSYPRKTGVVITRVEPGSPADKAGLEANDIAYSFDGTPLEDAAHFVSLVRKRSAGDKVSIVIFRDGKEKKLTAMLEKREPVQFIKDEFGKYSGEIAKAMNEANRSAVKAYRLSSLGRGRLGMALADLNEDLAPYFGVKNGDGALVLEVEAESAAERAGIRGGDVIVALNGVSVAGSDEVAEELSKLDKGDSLSIEIVRKGIRKSLTLEIEQAMGLQRLFISPFEQGKDKVESFEWKMKDSDEAAKLKEEMKALKERLKELEDRLDKAEKRE